MSTTTLGEGRRAHRYTRILESYRDANGKPQKRVLASFKNLSELAEQNLKTAVVATRQGDAVVIAKEAADRLASVKVSRSLRFLDVAVALRVWERCGLPALLDSVLPRRDVQVGTADIIAALTIHRCVSPGSKLSASKWYPQTALPELQRLAPKRFNNSRVHRALEALDEVDGALQHRLAGQLHQERGRFAALFLDLTNTWFVGRGPEMAAKGRTKEGAYKRRIGIALLCDDRGYPLRWATLSGRYHEADAMGSMVEQLRELDWVRGVPLVMDRAMGRAQSVEFLQASGVQFVTAIPVDEFTSHTDQIPYDQTAEIAVAGTERAWDEDVKRARAAAERAGYVRVSNTRYVLDLGECAKVRQSKREGVSRTVAAFELARKLDDGKRSGRKTVELAKLYGCTPQTVTAHLRLLRLDPGLQARVLDGAADGASIGSLLAIAKLPRTEQAEAFQRLCESCGAGSRTWYPRSTSPAAEPSPASAPVLRYVVQFNPERFVEQRSTADEKEREFRAFVSDLNRRLSSPHSRRSEGSIQGEIHRELRRRELTSIFDVELLAPNDECPHHVVRLVRNEEAWRKRRRFDGINLLVASPELKMSAVDVVDVYFAKDAVEKNFGTIKGVVELRPVRHRTDPKVRAHVTLCVLALLVERALEQALLHADLRRTAPDVLEVLSDCRLNILEDDGPASLYTVTNMSDEQHEIIRALQLEEMANDQSLRANIRPRT